MSIEQYIRELNRQFAAGFATEHTHRPTLKALLEAMAPGVLVTNEPKQIDCGAPDFVLTRSGVPFGYVEAKDLGANLDDKSHKAQLRRYTESLDNLIFTNYTEFRLLRNGEQVAVVSLADVVRDKVKARRQDFNAFVELHRAFIDYQGRTITTAAGLAGRMAAKARLLAGVIAGAFERDKARSTGSGLPANGMTGPLQSQLDVFRKHLIHDIEPHDFADIYAQTVAYGMFAARLNDPSPETFSRMEAAELIPANNPFLRKFFQHIAGFDLDERIRWIVDDLADVFRAADVAELMKDYGKATQQNDPFIHFYETFLGEYNPGLRKSRGVYYTPEPVVNFIVRAVDDLLRGELGMARGLADTSKTVIEVEGQSAGTKVKQEVHKVQILDPAVGTGTFLATIVRHIHETGFANQQGAWPEYVRHDLIPRLNGFEVLMASYAMAHTKLDTVLKETGCDPNDRRLRIFLTNSLEEHHPDTGNLFAEWLSIEAKEANFIKRDTPVMVVIGNPPYKGESTNKGDWITNLLDVYKQEPGGGKLRERNAKWINDDYVKFIRFGQHYIDRTGAGILAYINNHNYLDAPTLRGMRWSLLQSFDRIYLVDLHGNTKKQETAPDGSADTNVFDIQQGVSINLLVKTGNKKKGALGKVFHYDLYGERQSKYGFLWENSLEQVGFSELTPRAPQYLFVPKNYQLQTEYDKGFGVSDLFPINSIGIVTARDGFTIYHTPRELQTAIAAFRVMDDETARTRYSLGRDTQDWKVNLARKDLEENVFYNHNDKPVPIYYRPFDIRYTYYTGNSKGLHCRPRGKVMRHFIAGENVGLIASRITKDAFSVLCTRHITAHKSATLYDISYIFPLYLYPDTEQRNPDGYQARRPNLNLDIVQSIATMIGLRFTPEKQEDTNTFAPIDLFDYIYAVLHSRTYRDRYKEFLIMDFPRVSYPTDAIQFRRLVRLGAQLRGLHLLESPTLDALMTGYPQVGSNIVTNLEYKITDTRNRLGRVNINKTQYFADVPEFAWNFYVDGYKPAQKWLKDRRDRTLTHEDILRYQKIIVALVETGRLMEEIDNFMT